VLSEKLREKEAKAKVDSERLMRALIWLVDDYSHSCKREIFVEKSVSVLYVAKGLLWRKHWLMLRRHILEKLEMENVEEGS
jgi:hypothetical protein